MNTLQMTVMIAAATAATMLTRFTPFILFGKKTPKYIEYLGKILPGAALGMLVVYCFKSVDVTTGFHGIPELIALVVTVGAHLLKRNMLLSIAAGTVVYMLLVNFIFV